MLDLTAATATARSAVAFLNAAAAGPAASTLVSREAAIAAARAAAQQLASQGPPLSNSGAGVGADAVAVSAGTVPPAVMLGSVDLKAAGQAAAKAALAASCGAAASSSAEPQQGAPEPIDKRAAAAAAFAQSLQQPKKPRWGGSSELAVREPGGGARPPEAEAAKQRQALAVSELSSKLSAFRKDRGVDEPASGALLSLQVPLPEPENGRERNWVGVLIGKEGINKRRFEQQTGARISLRGKGAMLRSQKKDDESLDPLHVLLEADSQDKLDDARVQLLEVINPSRDSSALTLFDEQQLNKLAMAKTTSTEECAFCGKEGHHHSVCPKRRTKFSMAGLVCSACGCGGHTIRDCKADRSGVVKLHPAGAAPSVLQDADYAAFMSELNKRGGAS